MDRTRKHFLPVALILVAFMAPAAALAVAPRPLAEMIDARALSLGGATTAVRGSLMSARTNPATLAPQKGFYGGFTYLTRNEDQLDAVGVTVVDNSSSPIIGALQYLRMVSDVETEDIGLSLASGKGSYVLGVTTRYVHWRTGKTDDWDGTFVGDVGVLMSGGSGLMIGLVGRDLFASETQALEPRAALGLAYPGDNWTLSADFVRYIDWDFDEGTSTHIGGEWSPAQTPWSLRAGQVWDGQTDGDSWSVGFGWRSKKMEFSYGYQQNRQESRFKIHSVSMNGEF